MFEPVVFGPPERTLTGFFHAPAPAGGRSLGVVLCNPIGFEEASVHRSYLHLADRLAAAGIATLRFDYDGTGNSPARSTAPGRMAAWIASIHEAIAELRDRAGVTALALFGVRLGASLAARVALERGDIERLVLWGPVVAGRALARDLRAFRLLAKTPKRPDGGEEIAGYFFSAETLTEISAVDLLASRQPPAKRVLVLARDGGPERREETQLVEHWNAGGATTKLLVADGYSSMMRDDPYDAVVPFGALDAIVSWLAEDIPAAEARRSPAPPRRTEVEVEGGLREQHISFGGSPRLFGISTHSTAPVDPNRPAVCFLNVGANHLAAPHRMNVRLAREVAAQGYRTFRFDAAGLGDSDVATGAVENRIYSLEAVGDLRRAMDLLGQSYGVRQFVLVGLCSGAYVAFHTAVEDERVVGQVLLSPYAFEWAPGDPVKPTEREVFRSFRSTRFYLRAAFDPRSWRRLLQGTINVRGVAGILAERARERLEGASEDLLARLRLQRSPRSGIEQSFRALSDRGVQTLVAIGFTDGGLDMIARYLGPDARRMRGRKTFELQVLEDSDHIFASQDAMRRLGDLLKGYLAAHFQ